MVFLFLFLGFIIIKLKYQTISIYALKIKRNWLSLCFLFMILGILYDAKSTILVSMNSILLWANHVLPSLFCFFICLELLKQTRIFLSLGRALTPLMKPMFGVNGSGGLALLLGMTSGYPVGAIVATDLYEKGLCTKLEAEKILTFANTSGPLFIIGVVGTGMFYDEKIGILLFTSHILSSIVVGILFRNYHASSQTSPIISQVSIKSNTSLQITLNNLGESLKNAVHKSIATLTMILGFMVFFGVLGNLLGKMNLPTYFGYLLSPILSYFHLSQNLSHCLFQGFMEMTSGIHLIASEICIPLVQKLCAASFLLGFGGLSVHMQVLGIVSKVKLSLRPYFLGKMLHGVLASILTYALFEVILN